jgi:hypothetical protein
MCSISDGGFSERDISPVSNELLKPKTIGVVSILKIYKDFGTGRA